MMTKEFNLEMFKNGAKAQTKLGNPVKFITIANNGKMIVSVMPRYSGIEQAQYNTNGRKYNGTDTLYDLEMVEAYEKVA